MFSKKEFVEEIYKEFHSLSNIKNINLQTTYQSLFQEALHKHRQKKLFTNIPRKNHIYDIYKELLLENRVEPSQIFETVLCSKLVRSSSGVLPISIALDGDKGSCTYNCSMCPNECVENGAEKNMARSYLSSEGTFIRGETENFKIIEQIWRRLAELEVMGHPPDKLEFILLGGTFDCYPREYRIQTGIDIFYACNLYSTISLKYGEHSHVLKKWLSTNPFLTNDCLSDELKTFLYAIRSRPLIEGRTQKEIDEIRRIEQSLNSNSKGCRAIGIVAETRPDRVNRYSLTELRKFGCTRIQIGIQTDNDDVLRYNNRGHLVATSVKANKIIRDNGFKIDGHIMPDLPGTTLEIDYNMVRHVFLGEDLQVDYCKIYPCLDLPYTLTRTWKENGKWKPIAENNFPEFLDFLAYTVSIVPPWTRINRVQRDFPEASVKNHQLGYVSDTIASNLQQIVTQHLAKKGMKCYDIRSREIRNMIIDDDQLKNVKLYIRMYRANEGTEFFISTELDDKDDEKKDQKDFDDTRLLGLCRLRIPDLECTQKELIPSYYLPVFRTTEKIARIRELHVYGVIATSTNENKSQHRGIGKFLMNVAEHIAHHYNCTQIAVISGVGVRTYYEQHLGYRLDTKEDQFMIKDVNVGGYSNDNRNNLNLFGRTYDSSTIRQVLYNSIISKKYMGTNITNIINTTTQHTIHNYDNIGDAQGFSFEDVGDVEDKQEKEKDEEEEEEKELEEEKPKRVRKNNKYVMYIILMLTMVMIFLAIKKLVKML